MEVTRGEVSAFFVPLAFVRAGATATATFSGYRSEIESFELLITPTPVIPVREQHRPWSIGVGGEEEL